MMFSLQKNSEVFWLCAAWVDLNHEFGFDLFSNMANAMEKKQQHQIKLFYTCKFEGQQNDEFWNYKKQLGGK